MAIGKQEALDYHSQGRPGKISVTITKPCKTQRDLSLAYTPGVAEPCREIEQDPDLADLYTARANLVAVVSNGTAVLGLGNIGPLAGKPVMEGKGVLFKAFADIDVFDIEIAAPTADDVVRFCEMLEPTVGGINLEDIKAPECFLIERRLREKLRIPVFHDDQHGTAIISGAALLNAAEVVGKRLDQLNVVFSGAGASAIATAEHYVRLGVQRERITLVDSKGVVHTERTDVGAEKRAFARHTSARTLAEAMVGADVFVGLSVKGTVTQDMLKPMADKPIIFALANPDPEIMPEEAREARPDALIATGRSDYPNQVNNVLGFPFIFRGALDVGAQQITEGMKMAATRALAALAREDVPESVIAAYGGRPLRFGPDYLIPKPLDPRVCLWEAPAVAAAAIAEGVARRGLDMVAYKAQLEDRLGQSHALMRSLTARAARRPQRLVFSEGADERIIKAAHQLIDDDIAIPILLGSRAAVEAAAAAAGVPLTGITVVDPATDPRASRYAETLWERRRRKGVTRDSAAQLAAQPPYFASLMVGAGDADAMVGGIRQYYPDKLHAPLQVLGLEAQARAVAGAIMLMVGKNVYFLADTTLAEDPDPRAVADIALATARLVRTLGLTPRVALLSFSNFGSMRTPDTIKMAEAARILREERPDLEVDGEMMAETALNPAILRGSFPWSRLTAPANVLVFPNVAAANIGYQLVKELGGADMVGPILMGTARPVHLLRRDISVREVVYMSVIAAVDAQARADAASLGAERPAAAPHPARR